VRKVPSGQRVWIILYIYILVHERDCSKDIASKLEGMDSLMEEKVKRSLLNAK
jgi:hypothetical protein